MNYYSSVPNCRVRGHFAIFDFLSTLKSANYDPLSLYDFLAKRVQTFTFLGGFANITPKSPYYDPPPFYGFFLKVSTPYN